jgi:choline-sulfatase
LNHPQDASATSYNGAVSAVDGAVGQLIAALRAARLFDDALIVITSDHGESLGAHGEETHGVFLYDETIHVPLLLKLPQNQGAGKRVTARARLVDVAPTILEIAGVPVPSQMQGQSLLRVAKANADQPVYSMSNFPQHAFGWSALESWRAGKYLYIKAPKPELYDLAADPGATRNLAQISKGTLETIASQLDAFDRRLSDSGNALGNSELTSSEMQKLASLGYVGLQKSNTSVGAAATGTDPKDGIAAANKILSALTLLNEGKPDRAAAMLQPVPADGAKMYLLQFFMGAALARQQKYPQAIEYLRHAIELQPDSTWAHYEMGATLLQTGDYKTAVIHLEIASSRLPDFAEVHSLLAQAYEHLGRAEDAKRERSRSTASEQAKP